MSDFEPRRILCPIDFSRHSAAALRVGGVMAKLFGAELAVLHVQSVEAPVYFTTAQLQGLKSQLRRSIGAARKEAAKFVTQHLAAEVKQSVTVVEAIPVAAILKKAREWKAGLIAMGTHGRGGLQRVLMGSVAESVLHNTAVPILTVGPRTNLGSPIKAVRRVMCPVNFSPMSQTALEHAGAVAMAAGAELVVAHIVEAPIKSTEQDLVKRMCEGIPAEVRAHCTVKEVVKQGNAAEQIVEEAAKCPADLLVIGAQPRTFLGSFLFGSTTEAVIRSATCPVLSVVCKS